MNRSPLHFEQAVYGSFPFWDRGYAVLAQSPGCRPEWLADLRLVCQRYGEPPAGSPVPPALFSLRLPSGPWAIVGVTSPGADDQGRPGALAFHALLVTPAEFRKVGYDPFALAIAHRSDWVPETQALPAGMIEPKPRQRSTTANGGLCQTWIHSVLCAHERHARESAEPIEDLAARVWESLPTRVRKRASVATLAYSNANRFDLFATPRLAGVTLDDSYVFLDPELYAQGYPEDADVLLDPARPKRPLSGLARARQRRFILLLVLVACVAGLMSLLDHKWRARRTGQAAERRNTASASAGSARVVQDSSAAAPRRGSYTEEPLDVEERQRVAEALSDMAEQFGALPTRTLPGGAENEPDLAALMTRISESLRYRGPRLTSSELAQIETGPVREAERVLAWHAHIGHFLPDRSLPPDFAEGPLRWQLDTLCWSFHIDPDPRLSTAEVPLALGAALAWGGSLTSNPSMHRYPALDSYVHFLGRLPRR